MQHVDTFSRNPVETLQIDVTDADWILAAQLQDDDIRRIRKILMTEAKSAGTKHYFELYEIKQNKLFRKLDNGKKRWVVPKAARMQICRLCHDDAGHFGFNKTLKRIQEHYWFPKMTRFVKKYVAACLKCAYYKHNVRKSGQLHPIEKVPQAFHTLHIDHVGPFETSKQRNRYLFVIVDGFTKFTILEPVKSTKSKLAIKVLLDCIHIFGVPARVISDRGTAFTSSSFHIFCREYGVQHILNAVATPRANGQCERYNKTILQSLAASCASRDVRDWDKSAKPIQLALNTLYNKAIGTTPGKALLGFNLRHPGSGFLLREMDDNVERVNLYALREQISAHITADQERQRLRYNKARREARKYGVGDVVLLDVTQDVATGTSRKLRPRRKGPYVVTKVLHNDRYEVEDMREQGRHHRTVMAADRMLPWTSTLQ